MKPYDYLKAAKANAETVEFTAKLFAALPNFDFEAALEAGNEEALSAHVASLQPTSTEADAAKIVELEAVATEATAQAEALQVTLSTVAGVLGMTEAQATSADAVKFKATLKDNIDKGVVEAVAALGIDPEDDTDPSNKEQTGSLLDQYNAMPAGEQKRAFLKANQDALVALNDAA